MKISEDRLKELVLTEVENLLDEGFLDRLRARAAGTGEKIKGATAGIRAKAGSALTGVDAEETPQGQKASRAKTMAKFKKLNVILKTKRNELYALHKEFRTDLEALGLAGPSIDRPSGVMRHLNTIFDSANESLEKLQEKVDNIINDGER